MFKQTRLPAAVIGTARTMRDGEGAGGVMLRRRFLADAGELHIDGFQSNIFNSNKCPTMMRRLDWRHAGELGMLRPRTGPQEDYR